jgi:2-keto-4-pentenoate hydratase/2-oxohepta-3-ene-1,7-dioic acid hydratase in catechol pathway
MRIASYKHQGICRVGMLSADMKSIIPFDISEASSKKGLLALFENGSSLLPICNTEEPTSLELVEILAPIPHPRRNIFCVGKNYFAHVQEIADAGFDIPGSHGKAPDLPIVFSKLPECVIGHNEPIIYNQKVTRQLDYEAELGVVIGKQVKGLSREEAMDCIWGYTIINDVSARDVQANHKQWLLGKSQDTFCPMGPFAVSKDLVDLTDTTIRCWVNDELRQDGNTALMIFDVPTLIETISSGITLYPGDVIATGTPAGVGAGFDPPRFLKDKDIVTIEISGIGALTNQVISGQ